MIIIRYWLAIFSIMFISALRSEVGFVRSRNTMRLWHPAPAKMLNIWIGNVAVDAPSIDVDRI